MKIFFILFLSLAMLFAMLGQNPVTIAKTTIDQKLHPTDCGAAPGAVSLADRITWGLCESAKSASEDQKAGR